MRARHRHLNARDLGAKLVLDARYVTEANNDPVSTWADRSGNSRDATSSGTNRPLMSVSNSNFGGSSALTFASVPNRRMAITSGLDLFRALAGASYLVCWRQNVSNATQRCIFFAATNTAGFTRMGLFSTSSFIAVARNTETSSAFSVTGGSPSTNANVTALVANFASSPIELFNNGASIGTQAVSPTGNTPNTNSASINIGVIAVPSFNNHHDGEIARIEAFQSALSASQRKRLEHAAAYSFKISCN
jgi:hypothetical protein